MKLRFYAVSGNLVPDPRQLQRVAGEPALYVGRAWDQEKHELVTVQEATELDTEQLDRERLAATMRDARRGSLWCADEKTAQFCGAKFVEVEYSETEFKWSPKQPKVAKQASAGGKS